MPTTTKITSTPPLKTPKSQKNPNNPNKPQVIFFGNGPLAASTLEILSQHTDIIFHARTKSDLDTVIALKTASHSSHTPIYGVLASFGVLIRQNILELFEPEGIINLHPSLLPRYRGASPIESAILAGDTTFGVSLMKLAPAMDAGDIYYQASIDLSLSSPLNPNHPYPPQKSQVYTILAHLGATWLAQNLTHLPKPTPQAHQSATFTQKFTTAMSPLNPIKQPADALERQIRAFQDFPKSKITLFGVECTVLSARIFPSTSLKNPLISLSDWQNTPIDAPYITAKGRLFLLKCQNNTALELISLQPANRQPMSAASFYNGYGRNH